MRPSKGSGDQAREGEEGKPKHHRGGYTHR